MKKIKTTLLILILGISNSYSQKTIDFEIFGAPVYSYRLYKSQDYIDPDLNYPKKGKDYFDKKFKNQTDDLEKPIAGYLFGIRATFHYRLAWSIRQLERTRILDMYQNLDLLK